jgi:hypothetical protein
MLIIFFDIQGIVQKEFVPPGQTINGKFYCEVVKRLREGIWRRRPDKRKNNIGLFPILQDEIMAERVSF